MGAQTTEGDAAWTEIRSGNYVVQVRVISSSIVDLQIVDTKTFQKFGVDNYSFSQMLSTATLIAALEKKSEQNLKAILTQELDDEKKPIMKVTIKVTFDFLPTVQEVIVLALKPQESEKELLSTQLKFVNSEIEELQKQLNICSNTGKKYVNHFRERKFNQAGDKIIGQLKLPKGKYLLEITFNGQFPQMYTYFKLCKNGQDFLNLASQVIYPKTTAQSMSNYTMRHNVTLTEQCDITAEGQTFNSYQFDCNSFVFSALEIQ